MSQNGYGLEAEGKDEEKKGEERGKEMVRTKMRNTTTRWTKMNSHTLHAGI